MPMKKESVDTNLFCEQAIDVMKPGLSPRIDWRVLQLRELWNGMRGSFN